MPLLSKVTEFDECLLFGLPLLPSLIGLFLLCSISTVLTPSQKEDQKEDWEWGGPEGRDPGWGERFLAILRNLRCVISHWLLVLFCSSFHIYGQAYRIYNNYQKNVRVNKASVFLFGYIQKSLPVINTHSWSSMNHESATYRVTTNKFIMKTAKLFSCPNHFISFANQRELVILE